MDPIGTVQALDLLTHDQVEELFDEESGYIAKEQSTFDLLSKLKHDEKDDNGTNEQKNDKFVNDMKQRLRILPPTEKKTLILDVDNTLIYVRHFMDEMKVDDIVKLGDKNCKVLQINYRLDLEFTDKNGKIQSHDHLILNKDDKIPQRGDWFPDEKTQTALVHQSDPTFCKIKIISDDDDENKEEDKTESKNNEDEDSNNIEEEDKKIITISFLQNSVELSQLEPMMKRDGHLKVTFMYGGYLVRIRPNLAEFLYKCQEYYDIILFTAADGSVYRGLLNQVHSLLKKELEILKKENIPNSLWSTIFFRDDCDEKYDEYGLPFRHKNIAKFGRDLSSVVVVDDNPLSYKGFEPNAIRIAGFWGLSKPNDIELLNKLLPLLKTISEHKDVRYHLSGLKEPNHEHEHDNSEHPEDEISKRKRHSRQKSSKFLQHLKEALIKEKKEKEEEDSTTETSTSTNEKENNDDDDDDVSSVNSVENESNPNPFVDDEKNEKKNDLTRQSKDDLLSDSENKLDHLDPFSINDNKNDHSITPLNENSSVDLLDIMGYKQEIQQKQANKENEADNTKPYHARKQSSMADNLFVYEFENNFEEHEDYQEVTREERELTKSYSNSNSNHSITQQTHSRTLNQNNKPVSQYTHSDAKEFQFENQSKQLIKDDSKELDDNEPDITDNEDANVKHNSQELNLEHHNLNSNSTVTDEHKQQNIELVDRGNESPKIDDDLEEIVIQEHSCLCFKWYSRKRVKTNSNHRLKRTDSDELR